MSGRVVLLHGTSSSGKTTVARAVQRLSDEPWVHRGIDTFWDASDERWMEHGARGLELDVQVLGRSAAPVDFLSHVVQPSERAARSRVLDVLGEEEGVGAFTVARLEGSVDRRMEALGDLHVGAQRATVLGSARRLKSRALTHLGSSRTACAVR